MSADTLNANGEAGRGGQHGPMLELHVLLAELGMVSWLVSYTYTKGWISPAHPPEPVLSHPATRTHCPFRGLVSKAVVGQTEVIW